MNKNNQLGIAIIGCGYWGVNYVRVFEELPETYVATICDQRGERLAEVGRRFPNAGLTTQLAEALNDPNVDAVVVCTGAHGHYDAVLAALEAGKPVLVEKPMTTSVADSLELIDAAERRDLTLMVGHTFLYNGAVLKLKQLIDADAMGQLYYLYSRRTNLGPIRHDVNAIWDLAPHDISIFNYLIGRMPQWVSAVGSPILGNCREDVGFISLHYGDHIVGNIHVSWADPNKVRELVAVGSNRRIVFDDASSLERLKIFEKGVVQAEPEAESFGEYQFLMRDGDIISPRIAPSEPLKNQCRHFIDCVLNGTQPNTDAQNGLEVVQILRAIDRSLAHNGAPIEIEPIAITTSYAELAMAAD